MKTPPYTFKRYIAKLRAKNIEMLSILMGTEYKDAESWEDWLWRWRTAVKMPDPTETYDGMDLTGLYDCNFKDSEIRTFVKLFAELDKQYKVLSKLNAKLNGLSEQDKAVIAAVGKYWYETTHLPKMTPKMIRVKAEQQRLVKQGRAIIAAAQKAQRAKKV